MDLNWFELSLPVQIVLGAGYLSYCIAYTGRRAAHTTPDIAFGTIAFGLPASAVLGTASYSWAFLPPLLAIIASLSCGVLWRVALSEGVRKTFRKVDYSWGNDDRSAWETITRNDTVYVSQAAVELEDGTWLICEDTALFEGAPYHAISLGPQGDIALYVTHRDEAGTLKEEQATHHPTFGDRITYVPANRIRQVSLRFKKS
jgi:hypothetical protein